MISMTLAPPKPFSGLADGSVSPFCAAYKACPMSRRTCAGNSWRSAREDPIQTTGLRSPSIIYLYVCLYKQSSSVRAIQRHRRPEDHHNSYELVKLVDFIVRSTARN